jgi:hypothetical protein
MRPESWAVLRTCGLLSGLAAESPGPTRALAADVRPAVERLAALGLVHPLSSRDRVR